MDVSEPVHAKGETGGGMRDTNPRFGKRIKVDRET